MNDQIVSFKKLLSRFEQKEGEDKIELCVKILKVIKNREIPAGWLVVGDSRLSNANCRYLAEGLEIQSELGIELNFSESIVCCNDCYLLVGILLRIYKSGNNEFGRRFVDLFCRYSQKGPEVFLNNVKMNWRVSEIADLLFDLFWVVRFNTPL